MKKVCRTGKSSTSGNRGPFGWSEKGGGCATEVKKIKMEYRDKGESLKSLKGEK